MASQPIRITDAASYRIRVGGRLSEHWSDWFADLQLSHDTDGNTVLEGCLPDQTALHGVLGRIRDLGLPLLSVALLDDSPG